MGIADITDSLFFSPFSTVEFLKSRVSSGRRGNARREMIAPFCMFTSDFSLIHDIFWFLQGSLKHAAEILCITTGVLRASEVCNLRNWTGVAKHLAALLGRRMERILYFALYLEIFSYCAKHICWMEWNRKDPTVFCTLQFAKYWWLR